MAKFYEYPAPSGVAAGDEKIVLEKNGITYSGDISFIVVDALGDVDVTSRIDGSALLWNNANQKWEASAITPGNPFDQDLNTTNDVVFNKSTTTSTVFALDPDPILYGKIQDGWYPGGLNFDTTAAFVAVNELTAAPTPSAVDMQSGIFLQDSSDEFRGVQAYYQISESQTASFLNYMDVDGTGEFAFGGMAIGHAGDTLGGRLEADLSMFITDGGGTGELQISLNPNDGVDGFNPDCLFDLYSYDTLVNNPLMRLGNNGTNWKFIVGNQGDVTISGALTVNETITISSGTGSPEGSVTAPVGSLYTDDGGGAGTILYAKETGVGNTGWAVIGGGNPFDQSLNTTDDPYFTSIGVGITPTYPLHITSSSIVTKTQIYTGAQGSSTGNTTQYLATPSEAMALGSVIHRDLYYGSKDGINTLGSGGALNCIATEMWNGTSTPMRFEFLTTPSGSETPVERFRIDDDGTVYAYGDITISGAVTVNDTITISSGTGSPEGVVTAVVGSIYTDDNGGAGTVLYTKESGIGNTGWAVVGASVDLTAFSTNIIPDTDNTYDIGEFSTPYQVKDIYYSGIVYKDGTALTPIVASDTPPTDTEIYWIDTSS